ncbi:Exosome complex protein [Neolecta irregularis DAH-3]|uniref:Exosome complex protein n=1 Tax=Neolecta irregularis (strain DAH-3) TaxID=1198029 RepID=A0A1U7LKC5_NEOID|nr:Exosome complex protein [Neolecta irregularis DAH-3]|eukprot:OLL23088.1 Exosome complex protein [Neolecta irregularis DAH-3]
MDPEDVSHLSDQVQIDLEKLEKIMAEFDMGPDSCSLAERTSKLPLLDRAQFYITLSYAILSTLFSSLKLQGVDTSSHPILKELDRVKMYSKKIKNIEELTAGRTLKVDQEAAGRFLKAALVGNQDKEPKRGIHTRFGEDPAINKPERSDAEEPTQKKKKRKQSKGGNSTKTKTKHKQKEDE